MIKYHLIFNEKDRPNPNDLLVTDFFRNIRTDVKNTFSEVDLMYPEQEVNLKNNSNEILENNFISNYSFNEEDL